MQALNIIEPTLTDQTGHCYGYVRSLLKANLAFNFDIHVWLERQGRHLFKELPCQIHPYFLRHVRKIQHFFCLRTLIKQQQPLFIPTAGSLDLRYLAWLAKYYSVPHPIFLHFHQFKVTNKKIALLKKLAEAYSHWVIMAPTQELLDIFKTQGFQNCELVACPGYEPAVTNTFKQGPLKIIYAGAARADKGFPVVVDLIDYLQQHSLEIPVELQISLPHSGRYDHATQHALMKLTHIKNYPLKLHRDTLGKSAYQRLFNHAICLLIYDVEQYCDKFSGVALDAFSAGCPVITTKNTWAGRIVKRFEAGIEIHDCTLPTIVAAIQEIEENYSHYQTCAQQAGTFLQQEHDPANTLAVIKKYLHKSKHL